MKKFTLILITMLVIGGFGASILTTVRAADSQWGKSLHRTNCVACHASLMQGKPERIYTRADRRVTAYPALVAQVRRCALSMGLQWSDAQVENVSVFLEQRYYKFK